MYMYMVNKTNLNTTFLEFNASAVQITHTRNYACENYLNVGESYVTLAKESAALLDFTAVLPNISAKNQFNDFYQNYNASFWNFYFIIDDINFLYPVDGIIPKQQKIPDGISSAISRKFTAIINPPGILSTTGKIVAAYSTLAGNLSCYNIGNAETTPSLVVISAGYGQNYGLQFQNVNTTSLVYNTLLSQGELRIFDDKMFYSYTLSNESQFLADCINKSNATWTGNAIHFSSDGQIVLPVVLDQYLIEDVTVNTSVLNVIGDCAVEYSIENSTSGFTEISKLQDITINSDDLDIAGETNFWLRYKAYWQCYRGYGGSNKCRYAELNESRVVLFDTYDYSTANFRLFDSSNKSDLDYLDGYNATGKIRNEPLSMAVVNGSYVAVDFYILDGIALDDARHRYSIYKIDSDDSVSKIITFDNTSSRCGVCTTNGIHAIDALSVISGTDIYKIRTVDVETGDVIDTIENASLVDMIALGANSSRVIGIKADSTMVVVNLSSSNGMFETPHTVYQSAASANLSNVSAFAVDGNYAFQVNSSGCFFTIYDVSDPASSVAPVSGGNVSHASLLGATSMAIVGNYCYITTEAGEVVIIDKTTVTSPSYVSDFSIPEHNGSALYDIKYLANSSWMTLAGGDSSYFSVYTLNCENATIPGNSQMDIQCSEFENLQYSIKNKIKLEIGNNTQINISFNSSGSNLSSCLMVYRDRYYL